MVDDELASFRREMGLDSPALSRRDVSQDFLVKGSVAIGPPPGGGLSPASTSPSTGSEKSPRAGSRLFGRRGGAEEDDKHAKSFSSLFDVSSKPDRSSSKSLSVERPPAAAASDRVSPRQSFSSLFHREDSGSAKRVTAEESNKLSGSRDSLPILSAKLSTADESSIPGSVSPPSSRQSFLFGKKNLSAAKVDVKADIGSRKEMMDRRRSRSMHNIFSVPEDDDEFARPGLFGMKLEQLLERTDSDPQSLEGVVMEGGGGVAARRVPTVMNALLRKIETCGGFEAEGIFRISVATAVKKEAMRRLHAYDYALPQEDPYLHAALLKEWLMRLPDPLINNYALCLQLGQQTASPEADARLLDSLWNEMSPAAQAVVYRLMHFIKAAIAHEKETKMGATNFCMVKTLVCCGDDS